MVIYFIPRPGCALRRLIFIVLSRKGSDGMKVSAAGNTEVPAYLVLKDIATDIEVVNNEDQTQTWKVKVNGIFRD